MGPLRHLRSAGVDSLGITVADGTDLAHVRFAELVAALALGVDLGVGQPMEHMLRQCLIALRLAERVGLDEHWRADVYYTPLLVGVGCHTDAHEQAKWFGDDIALKARKYDDEFRSVGAAAAGMRRLGSGHAGSHRFRVALEFTLSGHREVADMITQHAAMTRRLAEQLGLPDRVLDALGAAYETWDGRGWPGELKGAEVPLAARLAQLAEFVEVAYRAGGVGRPRRPSGEARFERRIPTSDGHESGRRSRRTAGRRAASPAPRATARAPTIPRRPCQPRGGDRSCRA
jgi:HD domain